MDTKEHDSRELRKAMPTWFQASPLGKTILSETAHREAAERASIAERIVAIRREEVAVLPTLERTEEAAREQMEADRERLKVSERKYLAASSKRSLRRFNLQSEAERLERQLRDSAPVEIDDFISEMLALLDKDRGMVRTREVTGKLNVFTMTRPTIIQTNAAAVVARMKTTRDAIDAARALKIELVIPGDLGERLQALRKGIEAISLDSFEEFERLPYQRPIAEQARYGAMREEPHGN
jgi:hypothetical protein